MLRFYVVCLKFYESLLKTGHFFAEITLLNLLLVLIVIVVVFLHFTVMVILCLCVCLSRTDFIAGPGYINTRKKSSKLIFFLDQ